MHDKMIKILKTKILKTKEN